MTGAEELAENIVTEFNSTGAALSNTDETHLEEIIVKAVNAYESTLMESLHLEVLIQQSMRRKGRNEGLEEAAKLIEGGYCSDCAEKIRALRDKP